MVTPEEQLRERERVAIAATARGPLAGPAVSWRGIWAGFMVATAVSIVLSALGVAIGLSVLDANPATAGATQSWSIGAGVWVFVTSIIALFAGGFVASRTADYDVHPAPSVVGTSVWVLAMAAAVVFGALRGATLMRSMPMMASANGTPTLAQAAPALDAALVSRDVGAVNAQLQDPATASRIAASSGLPNAQVTSTLASVRQQLQTTGNVDQARAQLEGMVGSARTNPAANGTMPVGGGTAATIAGWVTFFILIATLAAAIGGAAVGIRPVAVR
jgi:hypothetical protein